MVNSNCFGGITDGRMQMCIRDRFNSVIIDDEKIGIIAAEHMADCGCKEIVVIQRVKFMDDEEGRVTNFQQRCMDLGVNVYIQDKEYEYSIEGGMKAALEAVRDYPKVDGLYYLMDLSLIHI